MKTLKQFVVDAQGMTMTAGWKEIFLPEVKELRKSIIDDFIYGENNPEAIAADRACIKVLDQILGFEDRVNQMAQGLAENPKDAEDVVQSPVEVQP